MNAHRIDVFHVADGDHVSGAVAHYLVLDLLPAGNTPLHQDLSHTGKAQAVFQDLSALLRVLCDTAAGAAQGIGRTEHHRIADLFCHGQTVLQTFHDLGRSHRLIDLFHGLLEHFTVLGLFDGQRRGSDETHVIFCKDTGLFQLHGQV